MTNRPSRPACWQEPATDTAILPRSRSNSSSIAAVPTACAAGRPAASGRSEANDFFVIPNQTGDVKLEANVEYRFNMFWKLYGALFIDAGNIWVLDDYATDQQFRWDNIGPSIAADWGFGLRVDLNFILVRLDTGFITRDPSRSQPWTGPDQWFRRGGYAIHFGVGYPF